MDTQHYSEPCCGIKLPVLLGRTSGDVEHAVHYLSKRATAEKVADDAVAAWHRIRAAPSITSSSSLCSASEQSTQELFSGCRVNEAVVGNVCRSISTTLLSAQEDSSDTRDLLRRLPEVLRAVQKYIVMAEEESQQSRSSSSTRRSMDDSYIGMRCEPKSAVIIKDKTSRMLSQRSMSTSILKKFPQILNPVLTTRVSNRLRGSVIDTSFPVGKGCDLLRGSATLSASGSISLIHLERWR